MEFCRIENINSSGTHGQISRGYTEENKSYIQKRIKFNLGFFKCIKLAIKSYLCEYFPSKFPNYIKSYRVEQNFYKNNQMIEGIRIPKIYDIKTSNIDLEYTIIMQDIPSFKRYRNTETIKKIIRSMNILYHQFEGQIPKYELWSTAGYWTGKKRREDKLNFEKKFDSSLIFFRTVFDFNEKEYDEIKKYVVNNRNKVFDYYNRNTTLIHGDLKIENLFVNDDEIYVIDWQWFGYGNPITDIMYLILTSLSSQFLTLENIQGIIRFYEQLNPYMLYDQLYEDFKIASTDFFEYLICCKWNEITMQELILNDEQKKDGLHVRKLEQIKNIFNLILYFSKNL